MPEQPTPVRAAARRPPSTVATGWLVGVYLVLTWATAVTAVVVARARPASITTEATVHAVVLAVVSILTLVFTINLFRGRPGAALRVRVLGVVLLLALVVTAAVLPLPAWMVAGHLVGTALLLVVVALLWPR